MAIGNLGSYHVFNNGGFDTLDDPNGNHVDIGVDGIPTGAAAIPGFFLETAAVAPRRCAWVDYDGTTLDVFLSDETCAMPALPLISKVVDIQGTVGNQAFIGFTSSMGAATSKHRLCDFNIDLSPVALEVSIDIKPGSFPNSINQGSGGVIPVAILGSATFDATAVDGSTCTLGSADVKMVGKSDDKLLCSNEDVSGPPPGPGGATDPSGTPDGFIDKVCKFVTVDLGAAQGDTEATVNCSAPEEIEGTDSIRIVPPE